MNDNFVYVIAVVAALAALLLGLMWAADVSPAATARRHHQQSRNLHGRVTCEYCLGLMRGTSHEQH